MSEIITWRVKNKIKFINISTDIIKNIKDTIINNFVIYFIIHNSTFKELLKQFFF